jgi:surface polysaccharide O-acyltransferase-like enzyme
MRNQGIDLLRLFSFVGVVIIHVASGGDFGTYKALPIELSICCRFAVPFFFIASGYFVSVQNIAETAWRSFGRVLVPYLIWYLIYNASSIVELVRTGTTSIDAVGIFLSGGAGFHLWFLPALFVGTIVVCILMRFGVVVAGAISIALYACAIVIDTHFYGLIDLNWPDWVSRNGLLVAPLFIFIGHIISKTSATDRPKRGVAIVLVLSGALLHLLESNVTLVGDLLVAESTVGVVLFSAGVFLISLDLNIETPLLRHVAPLMLGAYCVHLYLLETLRKELHLAPGLLTGAVSIIVVVLLSFAAAYLLSRIKYVRASVFGVRLTTLRHQLASTVISAP